MAKAHDHVMVKTGIKKSIVNCYITIVVRCALVMCIDLRPLGVGLLALLAEILYKLNA